MTRDDRKATRSANEERERREVAENRVRWRNEDGQRAEAEERSKEEEQKEAERRRRRQEGKAPRRRMRGTDSEGGRGGKRDQSATRNA